MGNHALYPFMHSMKILCFSIIRITLLLLISPVSAGLNQNESAATDNSCSHFSCGHLINIHSPFHLKSDLPHCHSSSTDFQILCDNKKPFLEWGSGRYYVISISYGDRMMNVIDPAFMNHTCSLPLYPIEDTFDEGPIVRCENPIPTMGYSQLTANFLNCTTAIQQSQYFPCFSHDNASVYVTLEGYRITDIQPSCSYLSMTSVKPNESAINTTTNVLDLLQGGFNLCWYRKSYWDNLGYCIRKASSYFADQVRNNGSTHVQSAPILGYYNLGKEFVWESRVHVALPLISPLLNSEKYFLLCMVENAYSLNDLGYISEHKFDIYIIISSAVIIVLQILQLLLVLMVLRRLIFMPLVLLIFLAHKLRISKIPVDYIERFLQSQQKLALMRYYYTDIVTITYNFREKLGQGGFGSVFRGTILNGRQVAVKMLVNSHLHGEEFINEVSTLGRIHHRNIVHLLGYCLEGSKRALVYEYMPNGSLDKYIFFARTGQDRPFSWDRLNEIALGVARGVDYLHRECDVQILHFDIKPHNILLDQNFVPKISDFGLAKLYPKDHSLVSISIAKGTAGYIAPEVLSRNFGVISDKSDVYSFGMLLLEMAGGRRNWNPEMDRTSQVYYPSWIYDQLITQIGEYGITIDVNDMEKKLCKVGLWCIQMKSSDRPTMCKVVEMLEQESLDELQMPPRPFFSPPQLNSVEISFFDFSSSELSTISEQEGISQM